VATFVGIARGFHFVVIGEAHLIYPLRRIVSEQRLLVLADVLPPHPVGAPILKQIGHLAALELLLGYFRALRRAAGVEVVAVRNGGAGERVRAEGVAAGAVVLAGVEAVGKGAGAILVIYKSRYSPPTILRRGVELALDDTVDDGNIGILSYAFNHARHIASATVIGARDVHRADAARDGGVAIGFVN